MTANLLDKLKSQVKTAKKRIVLPEGIDDRTLVAASQLNREGLVQVTLLGHADAVRKRAGEIIPMHLGHRSSGCHCRKHRQGRSARNCSIFHGSTYWNGKAW